MIHILFSYVVVVAVVVVVVVVFRIKYPVSKKFKIKFSIVITC